jgi:hypothetical protein
MILVLVGEEVKLDLTSEDVSVLAKLASMLSDFSKVRNEE